MITFIRILELTPKIVSRLLFESQTDTFRPKFLDDMIWGIYNAYPYITNRDYYRKTRKYDQRLLLGGKYSIVLGFSTRSHLKMLKSILRFFDRATKRAKGRSENPRKRLLHSLGKIFGTIHLRERHFLEGVIYLFETHQNARNVLFFWILC